MITEVFPCQLQCEVSIHDNFTANLSNGFVYTTTLLDAVGCRDATAKQLRNAWYAIDIALEFSVSAVEV